MRSEPPRSTRRAQKREYAMGLLRSAVAAVAGLVTGFMNVFTNVLLTPPLKATLTHLEETELETLSGGAWLLTWFNHVISR